MRRAAAQAAERGWAFRPFTFHDLRHWYAVEILRAERGSIYQLQKNLGHASIKTTRFISPT